MLLDYKKRFPIFYSFYFYFLFSQEHFRGKLVYEPPLKINLWGQLCTLPFKSLNVSFLEDLR